MLIMKVSHRLYLTVLPAILGVLAVAGLAYWGQYAHVVPSVVVTIAVVAATTSLVLSWANARYVAQRIERLAGTQQHEPRPSLRGLLHAILPHRVASRPDELDKIEGVVDSLSSAVAGAEAAKTENERAAEQRVVEYASLMEAVASASAERLEEVRLPLHILLENHFGDLNENQEEMLGAARNAAEAVDADILALLQIAELDLGKRELRGDRILPGDLLRALVPGLQAAAEQAHVILKVDIEPAVPAIHGDPPMVHDALATLLGDAIRGGSGGSALQLSLAREKGDARITLDGATASDRTPRLILAERVIVASGGRIAKDDGNLRIVFPL
jgi:signal transduction histidine kinase